MNELDEAYAQIDRLRQQARERNAYIAVLEQRQHLAWKGAAQTIDDLKARIATLEWEAEREFHITRNIINEREREINELLEKQS